MARWPSPDGSRPLVRIVIVAAPPEPSESDVAPSAPATGRRVAALTTQDLAIEQDEGRDHAEQNTLPYNHPDRFYPEAVFDAISWARGQHDDPPSGD